MEKYPYITTNLQPSARAPLLHGSGPWVRDAKGKRYLDFTCQTLNMALGHRNPTVFSHVSRQLKKLWFASSRFASTPFIELSKRLVEIAPIAFTAVNLKLCNGSDAVETAVKIARLHTRERLVICLKNGWHGESGVTLGFSSSESRKSSVVSETRVVFSREPSLESLMDTIVATPHAAAVLLDPAGVSNGLYAESDIRRHLAHIKSLCVEKGFLLIFDEVQTFGGFLGAHLFAADYFGVSPDIICLGKALGAGLPLAATLCTDELRGILDYNNAEYTSGGQAIACAAALGALEEYQDRSEEFARNYLKWQEIIHNCFSRHTDIEVRQVGFITTFTRGQDRFREVWATAVEREAFRAGLIVRKNDQGRRILVKPPIILAARDAQRACEKLLRIMRKVEKQLGKEHRWTIVKKEMFGRNKNEWYAHALLRTLGPGFSARTSTPQEQHMLSNRLSDLGIPAARVYADDQRKISYAFQTGEPAHKWLQKLRHESDYAAANAFFVRQQNAIELAHDHGIIIGDRWPGNTILKSGHSIFVDYDIVYEGDFQTLAVFEELFALFQSLAHLENLNIADRIAGRFVRGILRRHGDRTRKVWNSICNFYLAGDKVRNTSSLPKERYRQTAFRMTRHIEVSPRSVPIVSPIERLDRLTTRKNSRS